MQRHKRMQAFLIFIILWLKVNGSSKGGSGKPPAGGGAHCERCGRPINNSRGQNQSNNNQNAPQGTNPKGPCNGQQNNPPGNGPCNGNQNMPQGNSPRGPCNCNQNKPQGNDPRNGNPNNPQGNSPNGPCNGNQNKPPGSPNRNDPQNCKPCNCNQNKPQDKKPSNHDQNSPCGKNKNDPNRNSERNPQNKPGNNPNEQDPQGCKSCNCPKDPQTCSNCGHPMDPNNNQPNKNEPPSSRSQPDPCSCQDCQCGNEANQGQNQPNDDNSKNSQSQGGDCGNLIQGINEYRQKQGRQPLTVETALMKAAQVHSDYMARTNTLTHTGPPGGEHFTTRIKTAGGNGDTGRENCAIALKDHMEALPMWIKSPGHNTNLLAESSKIGVACAKAQDGKMYVTFVSTK